MAATHSAAALIFITLVKMVLLEHLRAEILIASRCNDLSPKQTGMLTVLKIPPEVPSL